MVAPPLVVPPSSSPEPQENKIDENKINKKYFIIRYLLYSKTLKYANHQREMLLLAFTVIYFLLGRVQIKPSTLIIDIMATVFNIKLKVITNKGYEARPIISIVAIIFIFTAIVPFCSQSDNIGPKIECVISQSCMTFELLEKHAAESIKKGVVGSKGTNTPMTPQIKVLQPNTNRRGLFITKLSNHHLLGLWRPSSKKNLYLRETRQH